MNAVLKPRIELSGVKAEDVHRVWKDVRPLLERVMEHGNGEFSPETILEALLERHMQLWVGHEDGNIIHAGITQIINFPTGKRVCEVTHLAGERMDEWAVDHCDIIESWAKEQGCHSVRIIGRKGWARVHKTYRTLYTTLSKELT